MDKQQEFVLRTLEERDIRFVRLWFTDVLGFPQVKSVAVAPAELEQAFDEGIGFDGSAIEGFARVHESDMIAKPDPSTFQILPWRAEAPGTARMFCDILMPDGSPSFADPRYVLKRALARTSDLGFTFYTHPEIEFFLLKDKPVDGSRPTPADNSGYFDHTPQNVGMDFRRQAITMLESMGISVEFSHHEGAPGQQEIDLRYADALSTADNVMTFRLVMKQVALEQGVQATFMPKPFSEHPGSGMHTHLSLFEGDRNAFYESGAEYQLSRWAAPSSRACCGTRRRSPPSPTSGSTPTSASGAAPSARPARAARPPRTSAGATTTARRWSACPCTSPARPARRAWRSAPSTPAPTRTWPTPCSSRPTSRASRRATSSRRAPRTTSGPSPTRNAAPWASSRSRRTWARRSP